MYGTARGNGTTRLTGHVNSDRSTGSYFALQYYRSIEINGTPKDGYSSGQAIDALKEVAKTLPAGYGYEFSGMSREEIAAGSQQTTIFAISIIFVFLFLALYMKAGQFLFRYYLLFRLELSVLF
jgi:multidrug efflux pump subunit AcrB